MTAAVAAAGPVSVGESLAVGGASVTPPNLITTPPTTPTAAAVAPAVGGGAVGGTATSAPGSTLRYNDPLDTL